MELAVFCSDVGAVGDRISIITGHSLHHQETISQGDSLRAGPRSAQVPASVALDSVVRESELCRGVFFHSYEWNADEGKPRSHP